MGADTVDMEGLPIDRARVLAHDYQPGAHGFQYSAPIPPTNEQERMIMDRALSSLQQIISSQGIVADQDFFGNKLWYRKNPETGGADHENPVTNPILTQMLGDIPKIEGFLTDYSAMSQDIKKDVYFDRLGNLTGQGTGPNGAITAQDWSQIGTILASKGADAAMQQAVLDAQLQGEEMERAFAAWQMEQSQEQEAALLQAQHEFSNAQFAAQQELQIWQQSGQWEQDAAQGAADRDLAAWQIGQQQGGEDRRQVSQQIWQTGENRAAQDWQTGEREGTQGWQTGERLGAQDWQTGEREGSQDWQSGENAADRDFQFTLQDDMQDFQYNIQSSEQGFIAQENALNRQLERYKTDLQNAAEHRNMDIVTDRNQQIRRIENEQIALERRRFKLEILQSFSAAPEMLFFMGQNSDPVKIFGELFEDGEGGSGGAALGQAFTRMMSDVQDPRFAVNLQSYSQMGAEGQAQSRYAQTARTGDTSPEQTLRGQAPLSMPSSQVTRQVAGRVR